MMRTQISALLAQHQAFDATEARHLAATIEFVQTHPDCCSRHCIPGHITASAWVMAPDASAVLLLHHKKLKRWLQPGGHLEDDAEIHLAAMREVREESGLQNLRLLSPQIFDVDVHQIPARGAEAAHYHYDVRFLLQAVDAQLQLSDESNALAWVKLEQVAQYSDSPSVLRMAAKSARA
ncbi:NUDIX hydrolase [Massilia sp. W12]|uniref:NUDIX hydrolase n=1 Tax=Massilia sp. W12 TaxID=3126507 RepID=UPI0030D12DCD